jgi:CheY-like chemotaxis protein
VRLVIAHITGVALLFAIRKGLEIRFHPIEFSSRGLFRELGIMTKPDPAKSRSVNDFGSPHALRGALVNMGARPVSKINTPWDTSAIATAVQSSRRKVDTGIIDDIGSNLRSTDDLPLLQSVVEAAGKEITGDMDVKDGEEDYTKEALETELRRLAVLKSYRVVGSGRNAAYERLVSLASRIFKAPICYITVIDLATSHILAARGLGAMTDDEYVRKSSISAGTITSEEEHLAIPDLTKDEQFKDHKNVVGLPHLRFYAAASLVCPEGYRLGTINVLDTVPRPEGLSLDMMQNLREIAGMVMDVMVEERERMNFEYRQPLQMIACTSNDLMTPLAGIVKGLSSIRLDEALLKSLSSQQNEIFNTAFACSSVMNRICQRSLESFNKVRRNRNSTQEEKKEDDDEEKVLIISDLVKHLHVVMDPFPKQVPLVITTDDAVPPIIVADDLKIFRSVVNYLTNACAKTDTGSVHLKICLKDDTEAAEENIDPCQSVIFSVEDTGCGIDVEQYQSLFKPIVRHTEEEDNSCTLATLGDSNATEVTKRTSLGLYSVATQISSIGGRYGFRPREFSESGSRLYDSNGNELKGSVFWFSIPLVLPTDEKESPEKPHVAILGSKSHVENESDITDEQTTEDGSSESTMQKTGYKRTYEALVNPASSASRQKRALLIEDSMVTRRVMSRMLKKLGFDVVQSVNGMEGLKELQANLFDIVLVDFLMPVMDGTDCVQQYRQFEVAHRPWFDQYIVGISAHASEADIERGMKVGMNDYREKPVTIKHIEEILEGQEYHFVTTRLDSIAVHLEEDNNGVETAKKQKAEIQAEKPPQHEQSMKVCFIVEERMIISDIAKKVAEEVGWKSTVVHNGESALRLLKMRNWDAVLLDDELPGITSIKVIEKFREWESKNRVNRQKNVFQVNSSFIPSGLKLESSLSTSSVQLPSGFDGALGKPLSSKILKDFLSNSAKGTTLLRPS